MSRLGKGGITVARARPIARKRQAPAARQPAAGETDAAVDQNTRTAGEGTMVPVAQVALEIELVIGEDGRELQREQAGKTEPEDERREMAGGAPGARRADRISGPRHRVELQAETRQPGREASARALYGRQGAMAQRQAFVSRLLDPLCATFGTRGLDGAEDGVAHRPTPQKPSVARPSAFRPGA